MRTLALVLLSCGVASACNGGPPTDPDCQNIDLGSCGTACCKMLFTYPNNTATQVKDSLFAALSNGGPDGRYAWQTAAGGTYGFSVDYKYYPYHYVGQVYHTTPMPGQYVQSGPYRDTVNFVIFTEPSRNVTTLRAFSISDINGALGDNGMNYKTIMLAIKAANIAPATSAHEDKSCQIVPPPPPPAH
eukprot:TRINITY_DN821_c0_g1_i2.p1 TRINITY_DN821_c0_g1~~TRINITY_DN821_c0_g1_i2.p1  ORF type:complete len:206 (+),score=77.97 TRINITY_DN821_c0_g1_i2:57-620(+)